MEQNLCHHQYRRFTLFHLAADWGFSSSASLRGDTTEAEESQAHCLFTKQPREAVLLVTQVLLNISVCVMSMFLSLCVCVNQQVFLCKSVNVSLTCTWIPSRTKWYDCSLWSSKSSWTSTGTHKNTHIYVHTHTQQTTNWWLCIRKTSNPWSMSFTNWILMGFLGSLVFKSSYTSLTCHWISLS